MLRTTLPLLCMLTLSGCSYSYDVQAKLSGGRLTFYANPQWGADCVREVEVTPEEGEGSKGAEAVWEQSITYDDACKNTFPVAYGERLKGNFYVNVVVYSGMPDATIGAPARSVAAERLRLGVVYIVRTTTGATGYGCGRFRLIDNRQVENLGCS
jgi:hypothetical protein